MRVISQNGNDYPYDSIAVSCEYEDVRSESMPLLDTRQGKDLIGTLISDIVLQLLSYVAQTERENIKKRQAEGIAAAKARGVKFGRPPRPLPENFSDIKEACINGKVSCTEAARRCGMPISSFRYRAGFGK